MHKVLAGQERHVIQHNLVICICLHGPLGLSHGVLYRNIVWTELRPNLETFVHDDYLVSLIGIIEIFSLQSQISSKLLVDKATELCLCAMNPLRTQCIRPWWSPGVGALAL